MKDPRLTASELRRRRPLAGDALLAAFVFAGGLALYVRTLAPTVVTVFDDSPEFQLVCYLLGVAHPTGYPLYTLLGKLFTLLPFGDVAYRVNLLSAVCAALALAFVALLTRELSGRRLAGALAALALAVSPVFWSQATIAEVYALHALFIAAGLWLLARWERDGETQPRLLLLVALVAGLALTHHRMIILFAPGVALVIYLVWRRWPAGASPCPPAWPRLAALLLALLLPLSLYLYIPLVGARVGSLDGTYQNTPAGFFGHVLGLSYGAFISSNPFGQTRDGAFYVQLWRSQFGLAGGLLGLAGLLYPGRRRRVQAALVLSLALNIAFALLYRVADVEVFLLPAFLLGAVGIGLALGALQDGLTTWCARRLRSWPRMLCTLGIALVISAFAVQPAAVALRVWPAADRSRAWDVAENAEDALSQPLPRGATIIGILGEMTVLRYFQWTQGRRPDVQTIAANPEAERMAALKRALAEAGEVYLTRQLPGVESRFHLDAVGPLIRVIAKQPAAPARACAADRELAPGICLHRAGIEVLPRRVSALVRLSLEWRALRDGLDDVRFSARLYAADGSFVAQHDSRPVHETYPTSFWQAGEMTTDVMGVRLPPKTPAGEYDVILIAYAPTDGRELGRTTVGRLTLPARGTTAGPNSAAFRRLSAP